MKVWFGSRSLGIKFLVVTVPIILLATALFCVALVFYEIRAIEAQHEEVARQQARRDALLLSHPVWNLEDATIRAILSSLVVDPRVRCIRITGLGGRQGDYRVGACEQVAELRTVVTPIQYTGRVNLPEIGRLEHHVDVSATRGELIEKIRPLVLLLLVLVTVLILCVLFAFRWIILAPLARVAASIRAYRDENVRRPVDWRMRDELGDFIDEYNAGLRRQEQVENELRLTMERTEQALNDLRIAKESLVQSEKLASLGSLVAGIAHEINTPVGNSLTVVSALSERARRFDAEVERGAMRKSTLVHFMRGVEEACEILLRSLGSAIEQIQKFKQVAVDQASSRRRRFDLRTVVDEVLSTLKPTLRHSPYRLVVEVPDGIMFDSFPGPLGQVVTNCFNNAIVHGFDGRDYGTITVRAHPVEDGRVRLEIADDGRGMEADHLKRVFDPFFTTRLGKGGSGLGMNLAYSIVTGLLGGSISIESRPEVGTVVSFTLPLVAPGDAKHTESKQ